jgi:hypothetical protein
VKKQIRSIWTRSKHGGWKLRISTSHQRSYEFGKKPRGGFLGLGNFASILIIAAAYNEKSYIGLKRVAGPPRTGWGKIGCSKVR